MGSTALLAKGRWFEILSALGIPEKVLNKRHQPCPMCGGKDRFRWTNYHDDGMYICSQCGAGNGFQLLMKFHGWTFARTAAEIDTLPIPRGEAVERGNETAAS